MTDESGPDAKLLALPINKLCKLYRHVTHASEMPEMLLDQIAHFFEHYKDLEDGKWVKIEGWDGPKAARQEILDSIKRYQSAPEKPCF